MMDLDSAIRHCEEVADGQTEQGRCPECAADHYEYCTCSECGYQNGENWMIGSQVKFCSNCGAKMGVEE